MQAEQRVAKIPVSGEGRWQAVAARWSPFFAWRPTPGGVMTAVVFFAASLTPSLLPRPWSVQGVVSGMSAAIGYGLGSAGTSLARSRSGKGGRHLSTPVGRILWVLGMVLLLWAVVLHWLWQRDVRRLMDMDGAVGFYLAAAAATAAAAAYVMVLVSRAVRRLFVAYRRLLGRFLSPATSLLLAVASVVLLSVVVFDHLVAGRLLVMLDRAYLASTLRFDAAVARPASPLRSGGPGSLIGWETIGSQGRTFVAQGPGTPQLEAFHRRPAVEPIRVYAGLRSADSIVDRAELAAAELERTGAFRRRALLLVAPTGTGWIDPYAVDPLEYMYNGDTAAVAVQYSHRPSWMVMLGNQDVAIEASRALLAAVSRRLERIPPSQRPLLLVYGESLGSFGWEAVFENLAQVRRETDGALWVGPPRSNRLWNRLVADRRPGSPLWRPIYGDGSAVRFGAKGNDLSSVDGPWVSPRVVYLQHASDPITWLSLDLMMRKPEWLREPIGPDVSRYMPYVPVVTFLQVVVDLVMGTNAPVGHGHKFGDAQAEAWALIAPPAGWSADDTGRLLQVAQPEEAVGSE